MKLKEIKVTDMIGWDEDGDFTTGTIEAIMDGEVFVDSMQNGVDTSFSFMFGNKFHQSIEAVEPHPVTLSEKIIACHGNLNNKSIAKMCGCDLGQVYYHLNKADLPVRIITQRSY